MLRKKILFSLLGSILGLTTLFVEDTYGKTNYTTEFKSYEREYPGAIAKNLKDTQTTFKAFPIQELKLLDKIDIPELVGDPLSEEDMLNNIVGHTLYSVTYKKAAYALYFASKDQVYLLMEDGRLEKGRWWSDTSGIHAVWSDKIHAGKATTVVYHKLDNYDNYVVLKSPRLGWFCPGVLKKGDTEDLKERIKKKAK